VFGQQITYGGVCGSSNDALFLDLDEYERDTVLVLKSLLGEVSRPVVLDVGANNGAILVILKALDQSAEVHCFEPFPDLTGFLEELVARNRFDNVRVNELLVGAGSGNGNLYYTAGSTATASVLSDFQPTFNTRLSAKQCSVDSYMEANQIERLALLKVDVEGGELEVLKGAHRTLARLHPDILLELLFTTTPRHLRRQEEAIEILRALDYRFFQIQKAGQLAEQWPVAPDSDYTFVNYLVTTKDLTNQTGNTN
jgi:FkbM family methyltransferase